jgi:excisionase family DNA binding protein
MAHPLGDRLDSKLMTPRQLADYLQIEIRTIYVWVSKRAIPFRKVGHLLRFDLQEIIEWTKRKKNG